MGVVFSMNKKGQISIEFILIMLIMLLYLVAVVQPTAALAANSTEDVARLSQTKFTAQKLGNSINELKSNEGHGKKTISLFVPKNSRIECDAGSGRIIFSSVMQSISDPLLAPTGCLQTGVYPTGEPIIECGCPQIGIDCLELGQVDLIAGAAPTCNFGGLTYIEGGTSGVFRKATVVKVGGNINVDYVP